MNEDRMNQAPSDSGLPVKTVVATPVFEKSDPGATEKLTGWKKWMWIAIAIASTVYIFIPEPTDAFPIIGWLDEGTAVLILTYALERLGIRIPLLHRFLNRNKKKSK